MPAFAANKTIDVRGLACPMPSVKTALALEGMAAGETLEVVTDDPVSKKDLPVWAQSTGNTLLGMKEEAAVVRIYLKKGLRID
ncbi:MAG: sulfurtransferase TusA family protein [Deltaproteobacteria bacterium]|nr:sulfurtransferase TusA family protein [Deltaproteobacteria bacterium]